MRPLESGARVQDQNLTDPFGNPRKPPMRVVGPLFLPSLVRRLDFQVVDPWPDEDIEANTSSERQDPSHSTRSLGAADASAARGSYPLAVMPLMISIVRGVAGSVAEESA